MGLVGTQVYNSLLILNHYRALGVGDVDVYLAQIYVADLASTVYGRFGGVNLSEGDGPHVAILGRSFLRNYTMSYEGRTGQVVISNDSPPDLRSPSS